MAKQSNKKLRALKTVSAFILVAALFLCLGNEKVIAQEVIQPPTPPKTENPQVTIDRPPPPPPIIIQLNSKSMVRYRNRKGKKVTAVFGQLSDSEQAYFVALGKKGEIQAPPPPRNAISPEMMEDFKNPKKYNLWIDGKKQVSEVLNQYKTEDFHHFFKTKVNKRSQVYGKYEYHLDMTTVAKLDEYLQERWIPMRKAFLPNKATLKEIEPPKKKNNP